MNSFTIIDYHFLLLLKMPERREIDDTDLVERMRCLYGVENRFKRQ